LLDKIAWDPDGNFSGKKPKNFRLDMDHKELKQLERLGKWLGEGEIPFTEDYDDEVPF
tara:strand:+ start:1902 stop:2075 length:174 start_codon:yes stop_codon:yes gene_type:complete